MSVAVFFVVVVSHVQNSVLQEDASQLQTASATSFNKYAICFQDNFSFLSPV
jgi:hypothetical protein